jgi:PAS domain S-box-containing protein
MMISPSVLADAVLRTNSDAIVAADKDGIIRFWNPGAERIFGHASGEAIGQSLDIIIPERLRARHWLVWRDNLDENGASIRMRTGGRVVG